MANKYCTKCGREVVAGKRFCGGCGLALPVEAAPLVEAAAVCVQCGSALVAGKKFCKQCGHAVGEVAPATDVVPIPEPAPVVEAKPVAEPAIPVCGQCGAELVPGKKFCRQCGFAVGGAAVVAEPIPAAEPAPAAEIKVEAQQPEMVSPVEAIPVPEAEPEIPPQCPASDGASQWTPVAETAAPAVVASDPILEAEPEAPPAITPLEMQEPGQEPVRQSNAVIGLVIGLAAVVLLAVGGGWAWYAHVHRGAAKQVAQTQPAAAPSPAQQQAYPAAQEDKPSAAKAVPAQQTPPQPAPKPAPSAPIHPPTSSKSWQGSAATPTPAFHAAPVSRPAILPPSAAARSGVRHYEGPPIPHGGTVVFDNLPKARLKFNFNHAAWQLIIKPNPDGTKKVTLISQAQGYQSSCDLGWEIVE